MTTQLGKQVRASAPHDKEHSSSSSTAPSATSSRGVTKRRSEPEFHDVSGWVLAGNITAVVVPFAALIAAIVLTWGWGFNWTHLGVLGVMYVITGLGITVGYHRLFTHRSFETNGVMKSILGIAGSMAVEGSILSWVADHRFHHQHSDQTLDPHSPHLHGEGLKGLFRGLWHAQVGWIFRRKHAEVSRYVADLRKDRVVRTISMLFPLWVVLGLAIPAIAGGLLTWSWWGVLMGFLAGGLIRVGLVHHLTWSVNSICHVWGARPFESHDQSRNNLVFGVLAMGEGWHNNHHAFPTSARHGLAWWQLDVSYLVIRMLGALGLATNIKTLQPERIAAKLRKPS